MRIKTSLLGGAALGALLALGLSATAQAQETTTTWRGAPQFANDTLTFKVRGRVYLDYVFQDVEDEGTQTPFTAFNTPDYDLRQGRTRTARLGVEGTWNADFGYKAEFSVQQGQALWEDLILEYKPDDFSSILIGNFKTLGLEQITSSRYITFMERGPYADVTDTGRVLNLAYRRNGRNWTLTGAVSGGSINDADVAGNLGGTQGDERIGFNGRAAYAPIDTDETKVHLGIWARHRDRGDEGAFAYQARPNVNIGNRFIATGGIADKDFTVGLEGALVHRNYSLQAEAANISFDRLDSLSGDDGDVRTGYVFVSWFPTGETRRYEADRGEFNRTRILNPVTAGGPGAVEMAVRYDYVDATDAFVSTRTPLAVTPVNPRAGILQSYTAGVNWYPFPYVRFQANYTYADNDAKAATPTGAQFADAEANTFQVRAQFDF